MQGVLKKSGMLLTMSVIMLIWSTIGCTTTRKTVVSTPPPTCEQVLAGNLSNYSYEDITNLLDESAANARNGCWAPLIRACLKENRTIPHAHLVKAVHYFNKQREEDIFHAAVYRYLYSLAYGTATYQHTDRELLETYCSYLIHGAASSQDNQLKKTRLLCAKLDPELHARLFE